MSEKIALYARVSSEQQAQEGTIESQVESLKEYVGGQGYKIEADYVFVDNGISGSTLVRPALDALRDRAAGGEIDKIVILCPDRLARKHAHQLILVEEFNRLGVMVEFVNHTITDSPEDQLLLQMQGVIAEFEREKILERSRRGKLHKAKSGKVSVLSGAPYGYVYIRGAQTEEARYEIHKEEAEVVRGIFKMVTLEHMSIGAIARHLNAQGIPTQRRQGIWERSTVWGILRNPAYRGQAAYRKTQVVARTRVTKLARDHGLYPKHLHSSSRERAKEDWIYIAVPSLVSEKMFAKVANQLEENKKLSPRHNTKYPYLLSGLLHCKECGYSLYGKAASNSKYKRRYYRCLGQDGHRWPKGRGCSGHPVRVEVLEDLVWEHTKELIEQPEVVFAEYSKRVNAKKKSRLSLEGLLSKKAKERRQQQVEKQRLLDLYQAGSISLEEISQRLTGIRAKLNKIAEEHSLLEAEGKREQQQLQLIEQFEHFKNKISKNLDQLQFGDKKHIVRLLVKDVVVDTAKEEMTINHIVPIDKSFPLRPRSNLALVGPDCVAWDRGRHHPGLSGSPRHRLRR